MPLPGWLWTLSLINLEHFIILYNYLQIEIKIRRQQYKMTLENYTYKSLEITERMIF